MKYFYLLLLLLPVNVFAQLNLVIPFATAHAVYDDKEFNNDNYGFGIEYISNDIYQYGILYINKDSYSNENIYLYFGRKYQLNEKLSISASALFAFNYDRDNFKPLMAFQYDNFRLVTSYPLGKVFGADSDVFNFQYVLPVKF